MIFQHTIDKVLSGEKTQTRRLVKPTQGIHAHAQGTVVTYNHVGIWKLGNAYAVQPGRGKKGVARIRITKIQREDARYISEDDALSEGFSGQTDFWHTWVDMHDSAFYETFVYAHDTDYLREYGFYDRPAARYDAWALTFQLVG